METNTAQRVSLSDGRMTIAGLSGRFVQAPSRRLQLEADGLSIRAGYILRDGALASDGRIAARARLPQDRLGLTGRESEAAEMPLAIRPLPDAGSAARMLLVLAHGGEEPDFHATLWLPATIFAALARDAEAGCAGKLDFEATTSLWLEEGERDAPPGRPVAWRLGPEADGEGHAPARGLVERIEWSAVAPPPPAAAEPEEERPETTAEALHRVNWSLKQLVLVLVFLLIVVALK